MCGIAGFIDFKKETSVEKLKEMTDTLTHRGPDDAGYEVFEDPAALIGFGQRRLSILDLSALGHQPMHFENLVVDFNGEIYNFMEIRAELETKGYTFQSHSDTEVILKGFHCWGMDVVHKFIGMFAFALYDKAARKVYLVRDRAGVKPLYYYFKNEILLFGSELKALYAHERFEKNIKTGSLALFLHYSYIPGSHSIFENTFKLLPGHYLELDLANGQQKTHTYWDVNHFYNQPLLNISETDAVNETERLLKSAYEYRMVADVPVGVFLSGGYDSSSVAALLQHGRTEKLKTFTIGFHEIAYNEAKEAKKIAEYLGTDHTEWYLTANEVGSLLSTLPEIYDEPFADNSTVPTVLVSQLARRTVKVALSADGGDEIFGGYHKFGQSLKYSGQFPVFLQQMFGAGMSLINPAHIPGLNRTYNFASRYEKIRRIWQSHDPAQAMKYISQYITEDELSSFLREKWDVMPVAFDDGKNGTDKARDLNRLLAIDYKTFLVDNNLVKVDRATMSVSLEGREPMLDHRIIEFLARVPGEYK
ncbi:MAG TPA: asparagine synthase (glutamine-hydrolyzing), partial [Chitinophagaceae bacterium]|nr:asparagine synthase (glutamine-hydrolyzing) [Chitinophagaceae bacterium]